MQTNALTVHKTQQDLILWLENVLYHYQIPPFTIAFHHKPANHLNMDFDEKLLKPVITNILSNAMKFTNNLIIVSVETSKNWVEIHIDDDGPGLPENAEKTIFMEFTTFVPDKSDGKHIGLGLAIVKQLIELQGGTIQFAASPQLSGTRCTLYLPYA